MNTFKKGDRVKKISGCYFSNGELTTLITGISDGKVFFEDGMFDHEEYMGEYCLVEPETEYPNPPHKHRDVIITWENGAKVEFWSDINSKWVALTNPSRAHWDREHYRVKPSATSQQEEIEKIESEMRGLAERLNKLKGEIL
ncbi:hypothetical protein M316_0005 [Nitrincola phage 1M3-16]|uniref:hypothetical protein n=1 Tax=Nitrincola phage 1M3-16 TaxID=1472912 RepID=UPI000444AA5A|nr:hypothetical protein GJ22_gp005 [Nitrincola phage 1M3-16]AHX01070.1 hypothetical protein M316_0005 [Nitrincola phage 1M3-16]